MQFASLGSGSRGNATLIRKGQTILLIDCGFSLKETEARLQRIGLAPAQLAAIFITHEHADHIRGAGALARKYRIPVWMTHGTHRAASQLGELPELNRIIIGEPIVQGELEILPYSVPHDATEPCQFLFSDGQRKLALLTDVGMITPHIVETLKGVDGILLECNHDLEMLWDGEYPPHLKQRVAGNYGHLNNQQAADLLRQINHAGLDMIVAMHISEKNNDPILARQALAESLDWDYDQIDVACQEDGFDWMSLG